MINIKKLIYMFVFAFVALTFSSDKSYAQAPPRNHAIICPDCPLNSSGTSGTGLRGDGYRYFKFKFKQNIDSFFGRTVITTQILHLEFDDCDRCNAVGWVYGGSGWPVNPALPIPVTTLDNSSAIHANLPLILQVNALANTPAPPSIVPPGCWTCGGGPAIGPKPWVPDHIPPVYVLETRLNAVFSATSNKIPILQIPIVFPPGALTNIWRNNNFQPGWSLKPHCRYCARHQGGNVRAMGIKLVGWSRNWTPSNNPVLDKTSLARDHDVSFRILVGAFDTFRWTQIRPNGYNKKD